MGYRIFLRGWINEFLPDFLRLPVLTAFAETVTYPIREANEDLVAWATSTRAEIRRWPQLAVVEEILNDRFDPYQRRIVLTAATGPGTFDAEVPSALGFTSATEAQFNALLRGFLRAGRTYTLVYV